MKTKSAFQSILDSGKQKQATQDEPIVPRADPNEESDSEGESSEEPSMADLFRKRAKESRNAQDDEQEEIKESKKLKKKKKLVKKQETDDSIKISVPKTNEEEEKIGEDEEEKPKPEEKKEKKAKKSVTEKDDEEEDGEQELSDDEEKQILKEVEELDESELTHADGKRVYGRYIDKVKELKRHLRHFASKAERLQKGLPEDYSPELSNNYKMLKSAHEELRKRYYDRFFEETPEWHEEYIKPLENASNEMGKWLKATSIDESDEEGKQNIVAHRAKIEEALKKGDEVAYYEHIDALAEFLKVGAAGRFRNTAPVLWEAYKKKEAAFQDKEAARKKLLANTQTRQEAEASRAANEIDAALKVFEDKNAKIIQAYKTDPRLKEYMDYEGTVENPIKEAKQYLAAAVKHGHVSKAMIDLVVKGVLFDLRSKETDGFLTRIEEYEKTIERLEKKIEDKEKTLKKVKPSRNSVTDDDDDDDDEDEEPKSFADLFQRRRQAGMV